MQAVARSGTAPEMTLRKTLWRVGIRYRVNFRVLGTKPDIVIPRAKLAVFVDGCFWHGCPVHYVAPVNNKDFWRTRLTQNQTRDARDTLRLQTEGWTVLRFWECEVLRNTATVLQEIRRYLA